MPIRLLSCATLVLALGACAGPDNEPPEELPLPAPAADPVGTIQGRVGADAQAGGEWQVCAVAVDAGVTRCTDTDAGRYTLQLAAGSYHVLAYSGSGAVAAHTSSTPCLRDGGVDCSDGRLLEVDVVAGSAQPAIDILDFENRQDDWPARPAG